MLRVWGLRVNDDEARGMRKMILGMQLRGEVRLDPQRLRGFYDFTGCTANIPWSLFKRMGVYRSQM